MINRCQSVVSLIVYTNVYELSWFDVIFTCLIAVKKFTSNYNTTISEACRLRCSSLAGDCESLLSR